jgi:hypothetical protein
LAGQERPFASHRDFHLAHLRLQRLLVLTELLAFAVQPLLLLPELGALLLEFAAPLLEFAAGLGGGQVRSKFPLGDSPLDLAQLRANLFEFLFLGEEFLLVIACLLKQLPHLAQKLAQLRVL